MSILNQILEKLELDTSGSMADEAAWIKGLIARQPPLDPPPISKVDVVKKLERLGAESDLDWKKSIVDLLKLLKIDSSLKARKELAKELGCPAELMNDRNNIKMNIWLHRRVLRRIAENGGNIPQELIAGESSISQRYLQTTEIIINGNPGFESNYVTWAPVPCEIQLADREGITKPIDVTLKNRNPRSKGGQVVFFAPVFVPGEMDTPGQEQDELKLTLPKDGSPIKFFIAGKFGKPSIENKDAVIEVIESSTGTVLSRTPLMVRIRKNASKLTDNERDRFLSALALLNLANLVEGLGGFADFANIHTWDGSREAHSNAGFLPWHRAFMLDLERELQKLDPSVTLPYWRFDEPAPNLFTKDYIGVPNENGTLDFSETNPLRFMSPPIIRIPRFDTNTQSAQWVMNEMSTMALGNNYTGFIMMEGDPHGSAHGNFDGSISDISAAAKDPLFFMLHANVDRLWAKWQWLYGRFDHTNIDSYPYLGNAGDPGSIRIGHNLKDTMWPWNQITGSGAWDDRPTSAPGGNLPKSTIVDFPGPTPTVGDMIDYQGVLDRSCRLGFDYDDVPFGSDTL